MGVRGQTAGCSRVLLAHADHDALVTGTSDDRGEDSAGSVVTGKAGLHHAGAIVNHEGSYFIISHLRGIDPCQAVGGTRRARGAQAEAENVCLAV